MTRSKSRSASVALFRAIHGGKVETILRKEITADSILYKNVVIKNRRSSIGDVMPFKNT